MKEFDEPIIYKALKRKLLTEKTKTNYDIDDVMDFLKENEGKVLFTHESLIDIINKYKVEIIE